MGLKRTDEFRQDAVRIALTSGLTRKHKVTTDSNHKFNIAPNLLDRDFAAEQPNQKWAGDIS